MKLLLFAPICWQMLRRSKTPLLEMHMALTNPQTAEAATETATDLNRPLTLLGLFSGPNHDRALIRFDTGETTMLEQGEQVGDVTLVSTGEGWAMVEIGATLHRLSLL
ncbi:MAG: hypothetical protein AAGL89_04700 [Pseudomonadota bacterium]